MSVDRERAPIASPSRRIYARAIELALPMGIGSLVSLVGVLLASRSVVRAGAATAVLASLGMVILNAVLLARRGQTLGKIPLGLVVIRVDGRLPGFARGFLLRELVPMVLGAIPVIGMIFAVVDGAMLLWTGRRRSLHDELADTLVLDVRSPPSGASKPV